jgi:FkbM family methyltransferase
MKDYSQYQEQEFLINYFAENKNKVLVDIGAADGINNSNSRYLLENGWVGVLVEPNKKNYEKLCSLYLENKNIIIENCGCSNESINDATFYIDKNDEFEQISTFHEEQYLSCKEYFGCEFVEDKINLIKTSDLFKKHSLKKIDFISIDTEGYDSKIINGINFDDVEIDLFCIENIDHSSEEILSNFGYSLIHVTTGNKFYKKN